MNPLLAAGNYAALVAEMTAEEKADLLTGHRMWRTGAVERMDIPAVVMTDGTYGVRYSIPQIDGDVRPGQDFESFLQVVGRKANEVEATWGEMRPATCFPNGSSLACSWDVDLARAMGEALGAECREYGVNILLGPGINIRRTPLGGRSYEYFSEDPILTGDLAAGMIEGIQSRGVGTSLKHFACNNSEVERTSMDSIVDMRALREIYFLGFERAIAKAEPWTVMSSYNRLNGVQAAEDSWLLTQVLRGEWGFAGLVMSDWHGIKDRSASMVAGNDLDMPETETRKADLLAAIRDGTLPAAVVDLACQRVLALVRRCLLALEVPSAPVDWDAHHRLARQIAAESIVLLKNEDAILPIPTTGRRRILVVGACAVEPVIQGSGCATTTPTRTDIPLDEIRALAGTDTVVDYQPGYAMDAEGFNPALAQAAVAAADDADHVLLFVNAAVGWDGEGSDRRSLALSPGHDELVQMLAAAYPRLTVIIASPDAVVMPWIDRAPAVVETFFSGQATGGAIADILFGRANPSGKLTTSFPMTLESVPGHLHYPGENGRHHYSEGLFVGYRSYDSRGDSLLFPFGHGLSYTRFAYADLRIDQEEIWPGDDLTLSFDVSNVGARAGKEVCQVYLRYGTPRLRRPVHELKGFQKVALEPGETRRVSIAIAARDLCYFDPDRAEWMIDDDLLTVEVGASSRDIRLEAPVRSVSPMGRYRRIDWDTQPTFVLDNPIARAGFRAFLSERTGASGEDADRMLEHCRNSFFGILTTLANRLRQTITPTEIQPVLDSINRQVRDAEQAELERHRAEVATRAA
ncbi:glycoside hydrolase family 3 C-terminal domain-containing protein [Sphingobium sp.]|uniref:glycoside hydrolase family 3 C-terminal domain-containing protein n=1 Tax=Sphingobium sp. TaxID=1912891 RepID=UPI002BD2D980|nr:glycoside hydrolase family 3 C-terminal domain-containing protein [Sphingobium sp.]HUD93005.1 glycoside hydrolase family 3 C-terminal domain-containing protein [Sphingobium sp.]